MSWNDLLFGVVPYTVSGLAVVGTIVRWRSHPFTVSSLSSQLLESRKLYWGSISFHWGLSLILLGHLAALVVPRGFEIWNGAPLRLYLLEITGLGLALWAAFGVTMLIIRRHSARIRRVTSRMDVVVLVILAVQIATGIAIAVGHRWGSFWGTAVMVPYVRSLVRLQPDPSFIEPLPWLVKAHVLAFFAFVAVFPFSRLVHIITLPLQYLRRPWQQVIATRPTPARQYTSADTTWRAMGRARLELSVECQTALDALRAIEAVDRRLDRDDLCDLLHVSRMEMGNIMAKLVVHGFVAREPGPNAGYELLVDLDRVATSEIVTAVEGTDDAATAGGRASRERVVR